jgi:polyisoprenyl-teichoic acid--peptidoglycan teichoic acid transferase
MSNLSSRKSRRKKKRKLRKGRVLLVLLSPFLLFGLAALVYSGYLYIKAQSILSDSFVDDGRDKSDLRDKAVDPLEDNISVLIIGADSSKKRKSQGNPRSDTLMLATLNKDEKSIKLLSIPRDSLVYIPYTGKEDKINHAYARGGLLATIETVENLLEIPVDYYVTVNFEAFIDIVEALGGVTVDVPYEFYEQNSRDEKNAIHLYPGMQTLDGEEALAFARTRKLDNDIERGKRQQQLIKSIVDKAVNLGSVMKYDDLIQAIGDNMTTNLTFPEIRGLISYGLSGKNITIDSMTLDGYDYQPGSVYYYKLDEEALEKTKQTLKHHLEIY